MEELFTIGFVEVMRVEDGSKTTDVEEDLTTEAELIEALVVADDNTATLVEVDALTTTDEEDDTITAALVELAMIELGFELVDALAVDVAITEVTVDFVDVLVVEAGTEEDVVLTTATFVDDDVPLTPFGEAGDQNTAGV